MDSVYPDDTLARQLLKARPVPGTACRPAPVMPFCVPMNRRSILFRFIAAGILGMVSLAHAQRAQSAHRIGYLSLRAAPGPLDEEFLAALRGLGYAEGRNLTI